MSASIAALYGAAWRFARVVPLAFLLPVAIEFAQHVVEVQAGMYGSRGAFRAGGADASRLAWGYAKTLALLPAGYWFVRYLGFDDAHRAWRPELPAVALFAMQAVLAAALQFWGLFGPSVGTLLGVAASAANTATVVLGAVQLVVGTYLTTWLAWAMLMLDSLCVGFLALTMAGALYLGARDAAARRGVSLTP